MKPIKQHVHSAVFLYYGHDDFSALFGRVNLTSRVPDASKPFLRCVELTRKEHMSVFQYV